MGKQTQEEINDRVTNAFFAYLKKSLQRSARNYIYAEKLRLAATVFLEDIPAQELDIYYSNDTSSIVRTRKNYHLYIQNELLAELIPELDEKDRDILFFLFYDGMTTTEAAEMLGVSQQAVSKNKNKLLGRLKCLLI